MASRSRQDKPAGYPTSGVDAKSENSTGSESRTPLSSALGDKTTQIIRKVRERFDLLYRRGELPETINVDVVQDIFATLEQIVTVDAPDLKELDDVAAKSRQGVFRETQKAAAKSVQNFGQAFHQVVLAVRHRRNPDKSAQHLDRALQYISQEQAGATESASQETIGTRDSLTAISGTLDLTGESISPTIASPEYVTSEHVPIANMPSQEEPLLSVQEDPTQSNAALMILRLDAIAAQVQQLLDRTARLGVEMAETKRRLFEWSKLADETAVELRRQQSAIIERLEGLDSVVAQMQESVVRLVPKNMRMAVPRVGLTARQLAVFEEIDHLEATGEEERGRAQVLVNTLVNDDVTEVFTNNLKLALRQHGWGVKCPTCGIAASPKWLKDSRYENGGCMQFWHTKRAAKSPFRNSTSHGGMTKLLPFILVTKTSHKS